MISSPQVILSLDTDSSLKKFISARYSRDIEERSYATFMKNEARRRARATRTRWSPGYAGLTFCFTHNAAFSNLLSFKNDWGAGAGSEHQTLFELEILDPTGEFEKAFLGLFGTTGRWKQALYDKFNQTVKDQQESVGAAEQNYKDYLKASKEVAEAEGMQNPPRGGGMTPLLFGVTPPEAGELLPWIMPGGATLKGAAAITALEVGATLYAANKENSAMAEAWENAGGAKGDIQRMFKKFLLEAAVENLDTKVPEAHKFAQEMARLRNLPMTTDMWITVGMGDDLATYAPPQLVRIINIEYSLDKDNVRKFILFLGPIAGLGTMDADAALVENIQGTTNTLIAPAPVPIFGSSEGVGSLGGVEVAHPATIIMKIIEDALGLISESTTYAMIQNVEDGIRKKFNTFVEMNANQILSTQKNLARIGLDKKTLGGFSKDKGGNWVKDPEAIKKYLEAAEFLFQAIGGRGRAAQGGTSPNQIVAGIPIQKDDTFLPPFQHLAQGSQPATGVAAAINWAFGSVANPIFPTKPPVSAGAPLQTKAAYQQAFQSKAVLGGAGFPVHPNQGLGIRAEFSGKSSEIKAIKLTNAQQKCIIMAIYSEFFRTLPGLAFETNFKVGQESEEKVTTLIFDTVATEYLKYNKNTDFLKDVYSDIACTVSFVAKSRIETKNRIKELISACNTEDEPAYIVTFPDLDARKRTNPKPRLVVTTPTIWNHLLNDSIWAYLSELPNTIDKTGIYNFANAWYNMKRAEAQIRGVYPLNNPYNPLRLDALLLNRQGDLKGKATVRALETFSIADKSINTFEKYKKHIKNKKIPIFTYGLANSNIIDFSFDLKLWFAHLLNVVPQSLQNNLLSKAVGADKGDVAGVARAMDLWAQLSNSAAGSAARRDAKDKLDAEIDKWYKKLDKSSSEDAKNDSFFVNLFNLFSIADVPAPGPGSFKESVYLLLARIFKAQAAFSGIKSISPDHADSYWVDNILKLDDSISQNSFVGTITTLPVFDLASPTKIGTDAIIYFVEPQVLGPEKLNNVKPYQTWLSGEYWIMGYEVLLDKDKAYTKFHVTKKPIG